MSEGFCSPTRVNAFKKEHTCFTRKALVNLANAWNESNPSRKITNINGKTKMQLWSALNQRMSSQCGDGQEWCWVDELQGARAPKEVTENLRPVKPKEWYKQPFTWLNNFDIEAVMKQYAEEPDFNYEFLGVYPIDFQAKTMFGACLFREFCSLSIAKYAKKGIRFIGMVTNLDRHDQSGSHWTSLFMCIDPSLPCFGAYYYDSVAQRTPAEVQNFMENVRDQAMQLPGAAGKTFQIKHNTVKHQYGNSECGVFSMAYQIRWLEKLKKSPQKTQFEDIVNINLRDKDVHQLRSKLFRPNTKAIKQTK